jgi:glycosyltransferase involved in cell wall biosynthesis
MEETMRISVVMPAYNEEKNIEKTVRYCFETLGAMTDDSEVVVIDDGSKDKTGEILKTLQNEFSGLKTATNKPNQGYGAALARAIKASSGDIVVTIDSDGQFDIEDARRMLSVFDEASDMLTGYRTDKKDSVVKVVGDRIMNRLIRLMFRVPYKDTNCALKIFRGELVRSMTLEATGFQLPTEIVLKGHAFGWKILEMPVTHIERKEGSSSLAPLKTAWQMMVFLVYLRKKIALFKKGILRSL